MKSPLYNILRLSAALLTILLLALVQYLPAREESILKNPKIDNSLYSETASKGKASIEWLNSDKDKWRCTHKPYKKISCGQVLSIKEGLDFSRFHSIRFKMWYAGDGHRLRIFLRNFEEGLSTNDYHSTKFMSLILETRELNDGVLDIEFSEFATAQWWVAKWEVSREEARVAVDAIHSIGIDFIDAGDHVVQVIDVVVVGEWIKPDLLYIAVLLIWMLVIVAEGIIRVRWLRQRSVRSEETICALVNSNVKLTQEQLSLKERVCKDPLTGALNREGFSQYISQHQAVPGDNAVGILLFDIDHFKLVNDSYGHDVGDELLKQLTHLITNNSRISDSFTRWGGEEFILMCPEITASQLARIAEKLRALIEGYQFCGDQQLQVTVSIGGATGRITAMDELIKCADVMLYTAKAAGRNQVKMSENTLPACR